MTLRLLAVLLFWLAAGMAAHAAADWPPLPWPESATAPSRVLRVGPGRPLPTPATAARLARDGDRVEIDAGDYFGDVAVWRADGLVLRGVGGRVRLHAAGNAAEGKAIWVIEGDRVRVENVAFIGARVPSRNGAGIRHEGGRLWLRNCLFRNNEMGLLTANEPTMEVRIENSEFAANTVDYRRYGRLGHNIYIGRIARFTLINSHVHDAVTGHNVKSRAADNYLLYNRIGDTRGASSYLVDLAEGGRAYLLGNLLYQNAAAQNPVLVSFAAEHNRDRPDQALHLVNNTLVNGLGAPGVFVNNHAVAPARLVNNIFAGGGTPLLGPGSLRANLAAAEPGLDRNHRPRPGSPAIDAGVAPEAGGDGHGPPPPAYEPGYPGPPRPRPRNGPLDLGAFEFSGPPSSPGS